MDAIIGNDEFRLLAVWHVLHHGGGKYLNCPFRSGFWCLWHACDLFDALVEEGLIVIVRERLHTSESE